MIRTCLGKITEAEFGLVRDYPFMMGLKRSEEHTPVTNLNLVCRLLLGIGRAHV